VKQLHNFIIPFQVSPTQFSIMVILSEGSIERIKQYDPSEIVVGNEWDHLKLDRVIIGHLTDSEMDKLEQRIKLGWKVDPITICRSISRGFQYRPDLGDHDRGPETIKPNQG
jgi:hypothetical protein